MTRIMAKNSNSVVIKINFDMKNKIVNIQFIIHL